MTFMETERRSGVDRRDDGTTMTTTRTSHNQLADREPVNVPRSFAAPGLLLGIGIGGLLDGIIFHRLLNWHHVLTDAEPMTGDGVQTNLLADGIFDLVAIAFVIIGLAVLWAYRKRMGGLVPYGSGVRLTGWILAGWALFNIVEGVLSHFVLDLHHVNEADADNVLAWDLGFLALSAVIGIIGLALAMRRNEDEDEYEQMVDSRQ